MAATFAAVSLWRWCSSPLSWGMLAFSVMGTIDDTLHRLSQNRFQDICRNNLTFWTVAPLVRPPRECSHPFRVATGQAVALCPCVHDGQLPGWVWHGAVFPNGPGWCFLAQLAPLQVLGVAQWFHVVRTYTKNLVAKVVQSFPTGVPTKEPHVRKTMSEPHPTTNMDAPIPVLRCRLLP